jgi:outer membrane lipoprotein-sorting protein
MLFPARSTANGQLDQILANMQKAAGAVKTIQARLQQEKRFTQIGGKETNSGWMAFRHTGRNLDKARIQYDTTGQIVVVDGNRIILYQPRINQAIKTCRRALSGANQEFSFFETPYTSLPELKRKFEISYAGDRSLPSGNTSLIDLVPRGPSNAKKLTLWVDHGSWLPVRYQIVELNGNISTFTLVDMKVNVSLPGDAFKVSWPGGTKVITEQGC